MKKTLFALLLVVALVVTVSAFAVSAEAPAVPTAPAQLWSNLTIAADGLTATGYCPHCCATTADTVTWELYTNDTPASHTYLKGEHHYFLSEQSTGLTGRGARYISADAQIIFHLNGQTLGRTWGLNNSGGSDGNNTGTIRSNGAGAVYILDNKDGQGKVYANNGWAINMSSSGASVTLYSGTLQNGNTSGTLYTHSGSDSGSSAANDDGGTARFYAGTTFTMFGGKVEGGKANRGGAL